MMSKIFDEKGNFNQKGKNLLIDFEYGLDKIMTSDEVTDMDENELRLLASSLSKLINDNISDKISKNIQSSNFLEAMSDEEFEKYMENKYGSAWEFVTVTKEEYQRFRPLSAEKIEEILKGGAEKVSHPPCNGVRFPQRF